MKIALIGLGAIGVPIAHRLHKAYQNGFLLIADEERKRRLKEQTIFINGDLFNPVILSDRDYPDAETVDLILICVKNYSLTSILRNIEPFIDVHTILLPLQNGIYAYEFFRNNYPNNIILRGYVQGPNTEAVKEGYKYEHSGELHIGSEQYTDKAIWTVSILQQAFLPAFFEKNILKMVWKKWMLNVAGNSITALTGADYSLFKLYSDLQFVCRQAMMEFKSIALAEGVCLDNKDIDDIIQYYVTYVGGKKTSMLMDVIHERKTENDYLAGTALQLAQKHNISVPVISTLFYLMEIKEDVYMEKKGCRATDLYTEGVEYSDALRIQMNDLNRKMKDRAYARLISEKKMPEQLKQILQYATENSAFYSDFKGFSLIKEFPVMDKEQLKAHYEDIAVHDFDNLKTHKMYTSGSTGMPLTIVQDLAKRERNIADLKFFGKLAGYSDHDPMCYLRAKPVASESQQEQDNIWQLDTSSLSEKNLTDYYHVIVERKCTALMGYSSTLDIAVDFWLKHFENETVVASIISTSESLQESTRLKLKDFFGESVNICARYSNAEQGILGQEEGVIGEYTLNWASYYFEILKMNSDEVAPDGELGRIVVTDLFNKAFPMIRFDTGDIGKLVLKEGKLPVLQNLAGRSMDIIYDADGEPVSPFLLSRMMRHSQGVKQWQFIQNGKKTYTLKISYDGTEEPILEKEVQELKKTLGVDAVIGIQFVDVEELRHSAEWKLTVSCIKE